MAARAQSTRRLEELVHIAKKTPGWGVTHGERHVYFTPPHSDPREAIQMSVHPGELNLKRLEKTLADKGLPMEMPKKPAHPEDKPGDVVTIKGQPVEVKTVTVEGVLPDLVCPECAAEGKVVEAKSAAGLGSHRRKKHGVIGQSRDALRKRNAQAEAAGEGSQTEPTPEEVLDKILTDVDTAFTMLRAEVDSVVRHAVGMDDTADWQRRAEEAGETLAAVRQAIVDLPMTQAYAKIAELVGADRT